MYNNTVYALVGQFFMSMMAQLPTPKEVGTQLIGSRHAQRCKKYEPLITAYSLSYFPSYQVSMYVIMSCLQCPVVSMSIHVDCRYRGM
jgi:hypothetical protein